LFVIIIAGEYHVTIGDVTKEVKPARNPLFVPLNYCKCSQTVWESILFNHDTNEPHFTLVYVKVFRQSHQFCSSHSWTLLYNE